MRHYSGGERFGLTCIVAQINTMILRTLCALEKYSLKVFSRHIPIPHPSVPRIYPIPWNIMWSEYHSLLVMEKFLKYLAIITPMGSIVPHPITIKTPCTCQKLAEENKYNAYTVSHCIKTMNSIYRLNGILGKKVINHTFLRGWWWWCLKWWAAFHDLWFMVTPVLLELCREVACIWSTTSATMELFPLSVCMRESPPLHEEAWAVI